MFDLSRFFKKNLHEKVFEFSPGIKLTGQSEGVGQSAQSIG